MHLIRHGQTTFNAVYDITGRDPLIFDAPLSPLGVEQVAKAAWKIRQLDVELIVTTPLTRALQTAVGLDSGGTTPILVERLHRERVTNSCDVGRSPAVLAADFPSLSFRHLPEVWWYEGEKDVRGVAVEPMEIFQRRVDGFRRWLARRDEACIVVVGHAEFFAHLTGVKTANCEMLEWAG
ncbi:histidine phosphatase family protein [Streptomyces sp. C10]|uniref:histidine phosphatase family protein n=1 Tax=Streptomyces sp. C10 TaxID=531941 RepID=UPI00398025AA